MTELNNVFGSLRFRIARKNISKQPSCHKELCLLNSKMIYMENILITTTADLQFCVKCFMATKFKRLREYASYSSSLSSF